MRMMSEEEIHGVSPIHDAQDIAPYLLKTPLEIAYVLKMLEQTHTNVAVYFNAGHDMMLTRVLQVDSKNKQFFIDIGGHEPTNASLLLADKALYVTALDGVKIQFSTLTPSRSSLDGKPAFLVQFPNDLVKLQRREFFRLTTPITTPYTISLKLANNSSISLDLHDISLGGVGIWLKAEQHKLFELGTIIHKATLELGGVGRMQVDLEIRNVHLIHLKQDMSRWMLGVKFVDLSRSNESILQRLMVQLERDKKALTG
ncbi:flagellar brake protein [Chitinibacter bivalviorum]|uniref:Flagellar brake protein YcgR n=1 Tax=Chitinibacter bivalviorum TaxID=2739434 RepID=A0A7H9BFQ1_9NEIS|nr:flagellar brake protein [Chitinibacter bivalviorum]QLG87405.1 flagellar brake protein [Chitinibacter bivalviorum]